MCLHRICHGYHPFPVLEKVTVKEKSVPSQFEGEQLYIFVRLVAPNKVIYFICPCNGWMYLCVYLLDNIVKIFRIFVLNR